MMMLNEDTIQTTLQNHQPPLDEEVYDYLQSFLAGVDEREDQENILQMLQEFLSQEECQVLLDAWNNSNNVSDTKKKEEDASSDQFLIQNEYSDAQSSSSPDVSPKSSPKSKRRERRKNRKRTPPPKSKKQSETLPEALDDFSSAWQERQEAGELWGGRGHGGRGVRTTGDNFQSIHLPSVSLQFYGNPLLIDSPMDIVRGHRYGLLGRNGVGKSTLLRLLAQQRIPGLPRNMRILLVHQQIQGSDFSALETLVQADTDRLALLQEQEQVENDLEAGKDLERNAVRLGEIVNELDAIDADGAEDRARKILKGLSFSPDMMEAPTMSLSGGWRMRLALAQALFVPHSDLILLDECTNHLDLHGMAWLIQYIQEHDHTLIVVSHDRAFLDAICTDMIVMEHQRLTYHPGSYSEYQRQIQEKAARHGQILDAAERQRSKALAFIQQNQKSNDPNKQRQAKMIKDKKLERIGNYREDGKRYKNMSMKQMDFASARLSQKVQIEVDAPVLKMRFPNPLWPPGVSDTTALISLEDASFSYTKEGEPLLKDLTLQLQRGSKVALVGNNGCGKSTLVKLLANEHEKSSKVVGNVYRHPNIRIGHVTQYSVEELEEFSHMTVVEYAEDKLSQGKAASHVIKEASGNVRQYLGAFGLGGAHAHRKIGMLSGGERMRLCFATVLADQPHILFLDESTNHVDLETLDSMADALRDFEGAVLMVSHNQGFLSGFCKELWVVENGKLAISHDDTESFDELFSNYRNHIQSSSSATNRTQQRRVKADMARRATKQTAGAKGATSLFA